MASTQIACADGVMTDETTYLRALQRAEDVDATDRNRLVLSGLDGIELEYSARDLTEAISRDWEIVNLATDNALEGAITGTMPKLNFHEDGTLTMATGCNQVTGSWRLNGNRIVVSGLAQGSTTCDTPAGVMEQEAALSRAVTQARTVEIGGNRLTLLYQDGTIALVATSVRQG
jgi:heat shock protein HslJ